MSFFRMLSKSWRHMVSELSFVILSGSVFIWEEMRSNYFVLWQCTPYLNQGGVIRILVYLLKNLSNPYPTGWLVHFSWRRKPELIRKTIDFRNSESSPNWVRQFWTKAFHCFCRHYWCFDSFVACTRRASIPRSEISMLSYDDYLSILPIWEWSPLFLIILISSLNATADRCWFSVLYSLSSLYSSTSITFCRP